MLKKISIATFWLAFFGFFLYKLIPKYKYLTDGTYKHWGSNTTFDNSIFALQFLPASLFKQRARIIFYALYQLRDDTKNEFKNKYIVL